MSASANLSGWLHSGGRGAVGGRCCRGRRAARRCSICRSASRHRSTSYCAVLLVKRAHNLCLSTMAQSYGNSTKKYKVRVHARSESRRGADWLPRRRRAPAVGCQDAERRREVYLLCAESVGFLASKAAQAKKLQFELEQTHLERVHPPRAAADHSRWYCAMKLPIGEKQHGCCQPRGPSAPALDRPPRSSSRQP